MIIYDTCTSLQDHIVLHRVKEGDITEDMKKLCNECGKVPIFLESIYGTFLSSYIFLELPVLFA